MLGWFHALMPREERFFDMFGAHARAGLAGAEALRTLLEGPPDAISAQCRAIMAHEHEADAITREVLIAIRRTFITPFDRGDIRGLITAMDDAVDQMEETARAISLFEVTAFEPEMKLMGGAVVDCAKLVAEALPLLRDISREATRIGSLAERISAIEGQADEWHQAGLKALFQRHRAPNEMQFIIGSIIYDHLESVIDRFDDVGNEISSIVIEHV